MTAGLLLIRKAVASRYAGCEHLTADDNAHGDSMLPLVILAAISRCASAQLCPTDTEILEAVSSQDDETVYSASAQYANDYPDHITFVHAIRITGLSDVLCSDELSSDPPSITCRFTVKYGKRRSFQIARLEKQEGRWAIADAIEVVRDRK